MLSSVTELAAAKVNLYLHVLGRRDDGLHELQSLVAFANIGDQVTAEAADRWSLRIDGRFAGLLATEDANDNLVLRAARRMFPSGDNRAALHLCKNLPVASGMGGGSADAAAALRCLQRLHGKSPGAPAAWADLGADIPVCLLNQPALIEGMGEKLTPLPRMPALPAVLVNPGVPSSTGAVFQALAGRYGEPLIRPLPGPPDLQSAEMLAAWLSNTQNDLTEAAIETLPVIGAVLEALDDAPGVLLVRMSGSGATCYGLFATIEAASEAARGLAVKAPGWWVQPVLLSGSP